MDSMQSNQNSLWIFYKFKLILNLYEYTKNPKLSKQSWKNKAGVTVTDFKTQYKATRSR